MVNFFKKKQVIILFAPPGAGKGIQADLLSDKLDLYYFDTSNILEEKFKEAENFSSNSKKRFISIENKKYDILIEKKLWLDGKLCSPPFVAFLVKEKIKKIFQDGKNIIFAGSPRTMIEAKEIIPLLKKLYGKNNIKVFFIKISPEETIFRNSHRRICELMRHSILYNKETENLTICPLDGSKLVRRHGLDDPETIKVRLEEYKEKTFPLLKYFIKEGLSVKKINGEQSVSDVFNDIVKYL